MEGEGGGVAVGEEDGEGVEGEEEGGVEDEEDGEGVVGEEEGGGMEGEGCDTSLSCAISSWWSHDPPV